MPVLIPVTVELDDRVRGFTLVSIEHRVNIERPISDSTSGTLDPTSAFDESVIGTNTCAITLDTIAPLDPLTHRHHTAMSEPELLTGETSRMTRHH